MSTRLPRPARLAAGDTVPARALTAISGAPVPVPDPQRVVHLQLRRFAGCPVCHLHLRWFARRADELTAAGIREVAVFHSDADELRRHAGDLPFAMVADPDKRLYAALGVESSPRALLDPRAWLPVLISIATATWGLLRGRPLPPLRPRGGRLGLPADFLIAPDGRVLACRYGAYVDDHWSVDEVLDHARVATSRAPIPAIGVANDGSPTAHG
jgi:peroxiredoxin